MTPYCTMQIINDIENRYTENYDPLSQTSKDYTFSLKSNKYMHTIRIALKTHLK